VDPLDVDLEDSDLLGEVEMTAALIVAANQADERLSTTEIDRVLGLAPADEGPDAEAAPTPADDDVPGTD
jgi:hypothetical protein